MRSVLEESLHLTENHHDTLMHRLRDPILRNAMWMVLNTALLAASGFAFWAIAARRLDAGVIGSVALFTTAIPLLTKIGSIGMGEMLVRFISQSPSPSQMLWRSAGRVAACGGVVGVIWVVLYLPRSTGIPLTVQICAQLTIAVAVAVGAVCDAVLIGMRRPVLLLFGSVLTAGVKLVSVMFVATEEWMLVAITAAALSSTLGSLFMCWHLVGRNTNPVGDLAEPHGSRRYRNANLVAACVSLAPTAILPVLVDSALGTAAVAYVALPVLITSLVTTLPAAVSKSMLVEAASSNRDAAVLLKRAVRICVGATAIGAIMVSVASGEILRVLGESYMENSTGLLRVLMLSAFCSIPNYIGDSVLGVRKDTTGFLIGNIAGSAWLMLCLFVGVSRHSIDAVGWAVLSGQLGYGVIVWGLILARSTRVDGAAR